MTRPLLHKLLHALTLGTALLGGSVQAQSAPANGACRVDARQHCASVTSGGGAIVACLQQHESELSSACQARLPKLAKCSAEVRQRCGDGTDLQQQRACIQSHRTEVGAACKGLASAP